MHLQENLRRMLDIHHTGGKDAYKKTQHYLLHHHL